MASSNDITIGVSNYASKRRVSGLYGFICFDLAFFDKLFDFFVCHILSISRKDSSTEKSSIVLMFGGPGGT